MGCVATSILLCQSAAVRSREVAMKAFLDGRMSSRRCFAAVGAKAAPSSAAPRDESVGMQQEEGAAEAAGCGGVHN